MEQSMPQCRNPEHMSSNRDTMVLVDEKRAADGRVTHYVFACTYCRDVNKVLAVQVRVAPEYKAHINSDPKLQAYRRARSVERDPTSGRIKYFR